MHMSAQITTPINAFDGGLQSSVEAVGPNVLDHNSWTDWLGRVYVQDGQPELLLLLIYLRFLVFYSVVWLHWVQSWFDQETDQITREPPNVSFSFWFSVSFCWLQVWFHIAAWLCQIENKEKWEQQQENKQTKNIALRSTSSGRGLLYEQFVAPYCALLLVIYLLVFSSFLNFHILLNVSWHHYVDSTPPGFLKLRTMKRKTNGKNEKLEEWLLGGKEGFLVGLWLTNCFCLAWFFFVCFHFGLFLVLSCLNLSSLWQNTPPKQQKLKNKAFLMVFGCIVSFLRGQPQKNRPPKKKKQRNKNKKGKS